MMGGMSDINDVYRVIEALMVIHNMCIDYHDSPKKIPDFEEDAGRGIMEEENSFIIEQIQDNISLQIPIPAHETDDWLLQEGRKVRDRLLDRIVPPRNRQEHVQ